MKFGTWLANQKHRTDGVGDLARDFASRKASVSRQGTRPTSVEGVKKELETYNACDAAREALARAVWEWMKKWAEDDA